MKVQMIFCAFLIGLLLCSMPLAVYANGKAHDEHHDQRHDKRHDKDRAIDLLMQHHKNGDIIRLNPTHIWYNYSDYSIYLNTTGYPWIMISLDNNVSTCATSKYGDWQDNLGTYALVGTIYSFTNSIGTTTQEFYWGTYVVYNATSNTWTWYGEQCILGSLYVSGSDIGYKWFMRASTVGGDSTRPSTMIGEWFGFTLQKTTAPTDYVVIIHASDGTRMLPITTPFWYSSDYGNTWTQVTP